MNSKELNGQVFALLTNYIESPEKAANVALRLEKVLDDYTTQQVLEGQIIALKNAKEVLGADRTNPGVTEDFNAGVEQITYVVNSILQGNIERMESELNLLKESK